MGEMPFDQENLGEAPKAGEFKVSDWVKDKQIETQTGNAPLPEGYEKDMNAIEGVVPTDAKRLKEEGDRLASMPEVPKDAGDDKGWKDAYKNIRK